MATIASVIITLDDDVPEYMSGIIRCGSVVSEDKDGNQIGDHQELIDNTEFHTEDQLIDYVAKHLGVDKSIIEIES
ncbi:MAG: hypothetical protein Q7T91_12335 [Sulfuricurvum sp.]|nr:hypothetical protein [Sulfuricurvum sp.]